MRSWSKTCVIVALVGTIALAAQFPQAYAATSFEAGSANMQAAASSTGTLEIYAGSDRYDTAHKIVQAECAQPGASYNGIIVCSGNEGRFPDALSAAGLSGVLGYPVVTVNGEGLTSSDQVALTAMKAKCPSGALDIIVVGSTPSVSASVQSALSSYGKVSVRFAGIDRYETNRMVYEYGASHGGWSSSYVFLSRGDNFPDALTIAPYLVWAKCPIVIVDPRATSLTASQRLAVSGASQVVALGSSVSVSDKLLAAAKSVSKGKSSTRLGGPDRYATSGLIVQWELARGMSLEGAGFATGEKFPDALSSSWLLGSRGSVLGLVAPSGSNPNMTGVVKAAVSSNGAPSVLRIFGSATSVPVAVRTQVVNAVGWSSYSTDARQSPLDTTTLASETTIAAEDLAMIDVNKQFTVSPISDAVFARMSGVTFSSGCPVSRNDLRYVRVLHADSAGNTKTGELVVNKAIANDVCDIFKQLYTAKYPIERMRLPDDYGGDDETSMRANNTSCFSHRPIEGTGETSWHSYGLAIDINPLYNPYYYASQNIVLPTTARSYVNRSIQTSYTLNRGDLCYRLFTSHGFEWGGDWSYPKDYQHFEKHL